MKRPQETMEYNDLVNYYRGKLLDRYEAILRQPERQKTMELLQTADSETLHRVLELLEK